MYPFTASRLNSLHRAAKISSIVRFFGPWLNVCGVLAGAMVFISAFSDAKFFHERGFVFAGVNVIPKWAFVGVGKHGFKAGAFEIYVGEFEIRFATTFITGRFAL